MVPDSEISKCSEHEVKSKIGIIFVNEKEYLKNIPLRFLKSILIFMKIIKKKQKLIKMVVNTYYLELMFILLNIFKQQKLMKKVILTKTLFSKKKDKKRQKKNFIVNLLELIQVKKAIMQTMRLVEYKYLLVNLKKTK